MLARGQLLAQLGSGGEVGGQRLLERQRAAEGRLRLLQPACDSKQDAEFVVVSGQLLAELRAAGEVGDKLLSDSQGGGVVRLRLLQPAGGAEQQGQVVVD